MVAWIEYTILITSFVYHYVSELQGMRDPLADSKLRLSKLWEHCHWVTIKELDAGKIVLLTYMIQSFFLFFLLFFNYLSNAMNLERLYIVVGRYLLSSEVITKPYL